MAVKKLYKVEDGKKICGVCGGLGEYFEIDPSIVRILALTSILFAGTGLILYIICAIVLPFKSEIEGEKNDNDKYDGEFK